MNETPFIMTSTATAKVEHVIETVNSGLGNIYCMAPNDSTLIDCLDTIIKDINKSKHFTELFGFTPDIVKQLLPYVTGLNLADIVIKRFIEDKEDPCDRMIHTDYPHVGEVFF